MAEKELINKETQEWRELALKFKLMLEDEMESHRRTKAELTKTHNKLLYLEIAELNRIVIK